MFENWLINFDSKMDLDPNGWFGVTLLKPANASFRKTWIWFSFKFKCSNSVKCFRALVGTSDNLFLDRTRCFKVFPCDDMEVGPKDFMSEKVNLINELQTNCVNKNNVCFRFAPKIIDSCDHYDVINFCSANFLSF